MIQDFHYDAVVLAGGAGDPVTGLDPALQDYAGQPLFEATLARLQAQTLPPQQVHVSANRNAARYAERGIRIVPDLRFANVGPLGGIEACFLESACDYLLAVPCHKPHLPLDLAEQLLSQLLDHNAPAAYARSAGSIHTCYLLHRRVLPQLQRSLDRGEVNLADWLSSVGAVAATFHDEAAFASVGKPTPTPTTPDATLTHFDAQGQAHMVDVSAKAETHRVAIAAGLIQMAAATFALLQSGGHQKGDVIGVARLAGIMAAKRCGDLIPLCHPLPLTSVTVDFSFDATALALHCTATCETVGRTGVEMEAMTAVSIALLTVYDMCKAVDRGMEIGAVRLLEKRGGKSGVWRREVM